MFVVQSGASRAARKVSILMGIVLPLTGSLGALFTLHVYARPSKPPPRGFRIFGFPRAKTDRKRVEQNEAVQ